MQHPASYRGCRAYQKEKAALKIQYESRINIHEARKKVTDEDFPKLRTRPRQETDEESSCTETDTDTENESEDMSEEDAPQQRRRYADVLSPPRAPRYEGTPWGPTREKTREKPKPQRKSHRNQRPAATREQSQKKIRNDMTPETTKKIVMDAIIEVIPQILNNFVAIICKVIFAHGISAEGKHDLINEGILKVMENFVDKYQQPERKRTNIETNLLDLSSESDMEDDEVGINNLDKIREEWMKTH